MNRVIEYQMKKIKLQDLAFFGDLSSSKSHKPTYFEWDRTPGYGDIIFVTDDCLSMAAMPIYKNSYKIAWLIEPIVIRQDTYNFIVENQHLFDLILTHHIDLLKAGSKFQYYYNGMGWIPRDKWGGEEKNKNISFPLSIKNYAQGHKLRHNLLPHLKYKADIFIENYTKEQCLNKYKFSIVIENCRISNYITEKLHDCIAAKTVPLYWGSPDVDQIWNVDSIIQCVDGDNILNTVDMILNKGDEIYNDSKVQKALEANLEKLPKYIIAEDWIWENILKPKGLV